MEMRRKLLNLNNPKVMFEINISISFADFYEIPFDLMCVRNDHLCGRSETVNKIFALRSPSVCYQILIVFRIK